MIAGLAFLGGVWWLRRLAPGRVDEAVRGWAAARVLAISDSIYQLRMGGIGYNPVTGSVSLDSFSLTTDSARNAARPRPLPIVTLAVRGGHVEGVKLRNVFGGGRRAIAIGTLRIDEVDAEVVLPPPLEPGGQEAPASVRDTSGAKALRTAADSARELDFFEWRRGVSLPKGVPRIRIGQVLVPRVTIIVRPTTGAQGQVRVLPQLAMELDSLVMDARDTATTPIYARDIRLRAERYHGGWDSLTSLSIERAEGSFADSVLRVDGVEIRPTKSDAEMRRAGGPRHTRVIATLGRFDARGIAWGEILKNATLAVRARRDRDAPNLDLLSDQNLPEARGHDPPRMPNEVMRDFPLRLLVDSVRRADGTIAYGELEPGKPLPASSPSRGSKRAILNLSNDPGRMSVEHPAVLTASARLMGTGLLSTVLEIPLLSERFDMKYHGSLGPMPFTDFNRFAAPNSDVHFSHGDVLGVEFDATVDRRAGEGAGGAALSRSGDRARRQGPRDHGQGQAVDPELRRQQVRASAGQPGARREGTAGDGGDRPAARAVGGVVHVSLVHAPGSDPEGGEAVGVAGRALKLRHYSQRTEEAYVGWIRRFVRYHGFRHPTELGAQEIEAFLTDLAEVAARERVHPDASAVRPPLPLS